MAAEASTDGENFLTLFSAPNRTYLGNEVQQFEVDILHKYNCYRLLCLEAEPSYIVLHVLHAIIYLFRLAEYYSSGQIRDTSFIGFAAWKTEEESTRRGGAEIYNL